MPTEKIDSRLLISTQNLNEENLTVYTKAPALKHLTRKRKLVSQPQLFFSSCMSRPNSQRLPQAVWKEKLGMRYKLSFSGLCFTAGF